jgi:hypothetical protein
MQVHIIADVEHGQASSIQGGLMQHLPTTSSSSKSKSSPKKGTSMIVSMDEALARQANSKYIT